MVPVTNSARIDHGLSATVDLPKPAFNEPSIITVDTLNQMLVFCRDNKADDLILLVGSPWAVIWSEQVKLLGNRPLSAQELSHLLVTITGNPNASLDLAQAEDIDFSYRLQLGRGEYTRFRCNATACLGPNGQQGLEIVMRPTGKIPPTMEQLGLPTYVKDHALPKSGIVLLCGPTGSGKTTTLDSFMRAHATHPEGRHILTYYAPIENDLNVIPGRTGLIAQSEIGKPGYGAHLKSFDRATRNGLRRHPQVIAYGEARDRETIEGAVLSSMTGHVTYTTTHTPNVHMAIPRMADVFAGSERVRMTNALIDNTRLIVHQRLLKTPSGIGRAPVLSALAFTQDIRSELLRTSVDRLPAAIYDATLASGIGLLQDATSKYDAGLIHPNEMLALEAELKSEVF